MLVPASVLHASYGSCRVIWLLVAAQPAHTQAEREHCYLASVKTLAISLIFCCAVAVRAAASSAFV